MTSFSSKGTFRIWKQIQLYEQRESLIDEGTHKSILRNIKVVCGRRKPLVVILAETRCEDEDKLLSLRSLGYDSIKAIPSVGRSGGLAVVWQSNRVRITLLEENRQYIHLECEIPGRIPFLLTGVYAIPHSNLRQVLWTKLKLLSSSITKPWLVCGDFNDIMDPSERVGGANLVPNRILWFTEKVKESGLSDMGFKWPKFTWKGPTLQGYQRLYERLDRGLANTHFLTIFTDCFNQVLPRMKYSDHNPFAFQFISDATSTRSCRPFQFEAMWLSHENFESFLANSWSNTGDFNASLEKLKSSMVDWNRDVFGFVERKKNNFGKGGKC